jgi:hypothetical protein
MSSNNFLITQEIDEKFLKKKTFVCNRPGNENGDVVFVLKRYSVIIQKPVETLMTFERFESR